MELSLEWMKHIALEGETEDLSQQHRIRHKTLNTTANISNKILLTNIECVRANQKQWNTSYLAAKH